MFDFDYEAAPQFQIGFESKYGPGIELNYWQYDESSNRDSFTSNGSNRGFINAGLGGPFNSSQLQTTAAGDTLSAQHSIDVESIGVDFFKGVQFPISRITGKFGFQYASITHQTQAILTNASSTQIGALSNRSDMHAIGPQIKLEYFRPVGHTKLELFTGFGAAVLFGVQDQQIRNSVTGNLSRDGGDELITILDFKGGLQYRHMLAENRYWFVRTGYQFQTWQGGGAGVLPQDDFGLRGYLLTIGYNR